MQQPDQKKTKYGSLSALDSVPFTPLSDHHIDSHLHWTGGGTSRMNDQDDQGPPAHTSYTFADVGITTNPNLQNTVIGKVRPLSDITRKEKIFVILMLVSIVGAAVMTIIRLTEVTTKDADFTFCLVLLLNAAFCVWFVIEGVIRERPSELFILMSASIIIMVYLIVNYATGIRNDVKLVRLVIACFFCPVLVIYGFWIAWGYHTSKRLIFRIVGANQGLQTLYRNLLIFQDFLKFDLQLGGSMVILILTIAREISLRDYIILSVGGFVTVVWFFLGYFTMPKEWKLGAGLFFFFSPVELAYVIYKMYDAIRDKEDPRYETSDGIIDSTIACAVGAILIRITVIITGYLVFRNFSNGLKEKLEAT